MSAKFALEMSCLNTCNFRPRRLRNLCVIVAKTLELSSFVNLVDVVQKGLNLLHRSRGTVLFREIWHNDVASKTGLGAIVIFFCMFPSSSCNPDSLCNCFCRSRWSRDNNYRDAADSCCFDRRK